MGGHRRRPGLQTVGDPVGWTVQCLLLGPWEGQGQGHSTPARRLGGVFGTLAGPGDPQGRAQYFPKK